MFFLIFSEIKKNNLVGVSGLIFLGKGRMLLCLESCFGEMGLYFRYLNLYFWEKGTLAQMGPRPKLGQGPNGTQAQMEPGPKRDLGPNGAGPKWDPDPNGTRAQMGPGPNGTRAQMGPGPKWDPGPNGPGPNGTWARMGSRPKWAGSKWDPGPEPFRGAFSRKALLKGTK